MTDECKPPLTGYVITTFVIGKDDLPEPVQSLVIFVDNSVDTQTLRNYVASREFAESHITVGLNANLRFMITKHVSIGLIEPPPKVSFWSLPQVEQDKILSDAENYGGHFISNIVKAYASADSANRGTIISAFGDKIMKHSPHILAGTIFNDEARS